MLTAAPTSPAPRRERLPHGGQRHQRWLASRVHRAGERAAGDAEWSRPPRGGFVEVWSSPGSRRRLRAQANHAAAQVAGGAAPDALVVARGRRREDALVPTSGPSCHPPEEAAARRAGAAPAGGTCAPISTTSDGPEARRAQRRSARCRWRRAVPAARDGQSRPSSPAAWLRLDHRPVGHLAALARAGGVERLVGRHGERAHEGQVERSVGVHQTEGVGVADVSGETTTAAERS